MQTIRFIQKKPSPRELQIGVTGENNAEQICFEIGGGLFGSLFLKLEGSDYCDKIPLSYADGKAVWAIERKTLAQAGRLTGQLQLEASDGVVWQSYQFSLYVGSSIFADETIAQTHPSVLEDHEQRITSLEDDTGLTVSVNGIEQVGGNITVDARNIPFLPTAQILHTNTQDAIAETGANVSALLSATGIASSGAPIWKRANENDTATIKDIDNYISQGEYGIRNISKPPLGYDPANNVFHLKVFRFDDANIRQLLLDVRSARMFTRAKIAGSWAGWQEIVCI